MRSRHTKAFSPMVLPATGTHIAALNSGMIFRVVKFLAYIIVMCQFPTVPRYIIKHYSTCFCEGILDEFDMSVDSQ